MTFDSVAVALVLLILVGAFLSLPSKWDPAVWRKEKSEPPPHGWPWSHREWEGAEIPGVGTVVGWDSTPGRVLCLTPTGKFVEHDLPDYRGAHSATEA